MMQVVKTETTDRKPYHGSFFAMVNPTQTTFVTALPTAMPIPMAVNVHSNISKH